MYTVGAKVRNLFLFCFSFPRTQEPHVVESTPLQKEDPRSRIPSSPKTNEETKIPDAHPSRGRKRRETSDGTLAVRQAHKHMRDAHARLRTSPVKHAVPMDRSPPSLSHQTTRALERRRRGEPSFLLAGCVVGGCVQVGR